MSFIFYIPKSIKNSTMVSDFLADSAAYIAYYYCGKREDTETLRLSIFHQLGEDLSVIYKDLLGHWKSRNSY